MHLYLFKDIKIVFYPTECNMSLCDAIIPTCKANEKLVVGYHPLSCCPQYRCGKGNVKPQLVESFLYLYYMLEENLHYRLFWLLTEWDTVNSTRQLYMFSPLFFLFVFCVTSDLQSIWDILFYLAYEEYIFFIFFVLFQWFLLKQCFSHILQNVILQFVLMPPSPGAEKINLLLKQNRKIPVVSLISVVRSF